MPTVPQDHKKKTGASVDAPTSFTATARNRDWTVETAALNDFELLDAMGRIDAGEYAALPGAIRRMLGPVQYQEAMNLLRDRGTGRVTLDAGAEFVKELFEALPNSSGPRG